MTQNRFFLLRDIKVSLQREKESGYDETALELAKIKIRRSPFFSSFGEPVCSVFKRSIDARDKQTIFLVYAVAFRFPTDSRVYSLSIEEIKYRVKRDNVTVIDDAPLVIPPFRGSARPVVCGFGPCGMFAALILAEAGARPIVLERGADADTRVMIVEDYWKNGVLSEETNVQFGEGGAGTFSDGKLMTRIHDPLCDYVLRTFARNGADQSILVSAKPHVGTDKLRKIVKSIRSRIVSLGGEVRFCHTLTSLTLSSDGKKAEIGVNRDATSLQTDALFLAVGHSARDTFRMLSASGVHITSKPFSVGVRIEHLQSRIDDALYGSFAGHPFLGRGEYALSARKGDRAVYTFCMCPGGTVVASASEKGAIVTNGMSYAARDGVNANSALAVSVAENDFGSDPFCAMDFQASIERAAFCLAGSSGAAPIETVSSFLGANRKDPSDVLPTYTGKTRVCLLSSILPPFVTEMLTFGLRDFDRKIAGFASDSALLTAPETRTSSPVRLPRDSSYRAQGFSCLYTCGEGAGYAGGITSAAVDGIRAALSYLEAQGRM